MKAENDYVEKGIALAYAMFSTMMSWETKQENLPYRILLKKCISGRNTAASKFKVHFGRRNEQQAH